MTYSELVENYDRLHLRPNLKSGPNILASLKQPVLHHLFDQGAGNVTKRDLVAAADTLRDANKPHAAANMLKAQRAMYNWAVDRGDVEANPCEGMRQPRTAAARERTLTDQEIAAVLGACDRVPAPFGAVVRVLLHTGARRNEVAQMRWSELDGNVWTLPAARSKSGRANSLPLPPAVMAVIDAQARPADGGDGYVFSTTDGARPSSDFSKRKRLLDEASEVTGWRLHDLRRTARSLMAKLGVDREVARRVVGHSVDQLDAIYDRHDYVKEKEHALSIVAEYLAHAELRSESTLFV
jgi:integrase